MCSGNKKNPGKKKQFFKRSALVNLGYQVSGFHADPSALKVLKIPFSEGLKKIFFLFKK
jgi:hypothetical protein